MIKKLKILAPVLLATLASVQTQATVIAQGSVEWNFNVAPDTIRYPYSGGYFGSIMSFAPFSETQAFLDSSYSGDLTVGDSHLSANWDSTSGNSSGALRAVKQPSEVIGALVSFNTMALFEVYTDVLAFSYSYNFFGEKETADDWLSFFVQAEITDVDNGVTVYSDYNPNTPNFRSQLTSFPTVDSLTTSAAGSQHFSVGTTGEFRTWRIVSDMLMAGRDSVGATATVSESNPMVLVLISLLALIGLRRRNATN